MIAERRRLEFVLEQHRVTGGLCCRHCGGRELQLDGAFTEEPERALHRIWSCATCGLSHLERQLTEERVAALEDANPRYQIDEEDVECRVTEHGFILPLLNRYRSAGSVLDVGCSRGYKLEAARRAGWRVAGVELSSASAHFARTVFGLDVHLGTLDSYAPSADFDAVIAWHVLEHVPSPSAFLGLVNALLVNGGHLYLQVPSYDCYQPLPDWSSHPENFCAVHYWHFRREPLRRLLVEHGFKPVFELDDTGWRHLTFIAEKIADPA
jgi:2-polyprenyl-3-methyl-5-hydroxy-6-metoxy-1,4-benzoquinol methylase